MAKKNKKYLIQKITQKMDTILEKIKLSKDNKQKLKDKYNKLSKKRLKLKKDR